MATALQSTGATCGAVTHSGRHGLPIPSSSCLPSPMAASTALLRRHKQAAAFSCSRSRARLVTKAAMNPDMEAAMKQQMEAALQDPEAKSRYEALQKQMQTPEAMAQAQQMATMMQNPTMIKKIQELQEDPELKPMFDELKSGGMGAMMKFMSDPEFLAKIGRKMGDVPAGVVQPPPAAAAPPAPEIETLLDAAKYGDVEAVEDFLAVGKDVNTADEEGRTPLHYGVAYSHMPVMEVLVDSGADLEARDSKGNTPLHYAAGYGRAAFAKVLVERGADKAAENGAAQTPFMLVELEPRNPINQDKEAFEALKP